MKSRKRSGFSRAMSELTYPVMPEVQVVHFIEHFVRTRQLLVDVLHADYGNVVLAADAPSLGIVREDDQAAAAAQGVVPALHLLRELMEDGRGGEDEEPSLVGGKSIAVEGGDAVRGLSVAHIYGLCRFR